jgi:uncharacterized membrane protein
MITKCLFTFIAVLFSLFVHAQDSLAAEAERNATGLRAEGKIYVVMLVAVTILVGLFIYLIKLDKKISRLEKNK